MKNLRTSVLYVCLAFCSLSAVAQIQTNRSKSPDFTKLVLFGNVPEKISASLPTLNSLFNTTVGKDVNINLSDKEKFQFEGQVISVSGKETGNVQSMVIRSTNYDGARFTLSKITNVDGTVSYSGRIMSFRHNDILELKNQDNHLIFIKRKYDDLVNE